MVFVTLLLIVQYIVLIAMNHLYMIHAWADIKPWQTYLP